MIRQYQNSPRLMKLMDNMRGYLDPSASIDDFYNLVWNVDTAQGFGLDIWGRIVGVGRTLRFVEAGQYFGFDVTTKDFSPFGQQSLYNGADATTSYTLTDPLYRTLILCKALANISATTAPSINQLLQNLFNPATGPYVADGYVAAGYLATSSSRRCYVMDGLDMSMMYVFDFFLSPYEVAVIAQSGVLPRPAGVQAYLMQIDAQNTFGFAEMGGMQPFGYGTFANNHVMKVQ